MEIQFKTRQFYPDEQRLLKTLQSKKSKEKVTKIRLYHFVMAVLLGICFTYLAVLTNESFWALPFGTIAVFMFAFIIFMPFEIYKKKKKQDSFLSELDSIINKGTVDTLLINAKRIAVAKEYEDEGDLFIIEYEPDKVLYLWDYDYNLRKRFPCLDFEIYEPNFFKLLGRQVYPLSQRIKPLIIDKKAKWKYMSAPGIPGQLETDNINLDQLMESYNNLA